MGCSLLGMRREPHQAAVKVSLQKKAWYLSCNIITRKSHGTDPIPSVSVILEYSSGPGTRPKSAGALGAKFRFQVPEQPQNPSATRCPPKGRHQLLVPPSALRGAKHTPKGSSGSHKINSEFLDVPQALVPEQCPATSLCSLE